MKNLEIVENFNKLQALQTSIGTGIRFNAKVSFAIIRNFRMLEPIAQDLLQAYTILVRKYGEPIENEEGDYRIKQENLEAFKQEVKILEDIETPINIIKIKFSDIEHISLSIKEMDALYFMIDDQEED